MSTRITRTILVGQLEQLNHTLANVGSPLRYELSIWSPGDGWTRYQLHYTDTRSDASLVCDASAMYDVLFALQNLAWYFKGRAR